MVVGGSTSYGSIEASTKPFIERLFSLRHQHGYNRGKLAVTDVTGTGRGVPERKEANYQFRDSLALRGMEVLGRQKGIGKPEWMICGYGQGCPRRGFVIMLRSTHRQYRLKGYVAR